MFAYFSLLVLVFIHQKNWQYIASPMGSWYLVEVIGFVVVPMLMFFLSYRYHSLTWIKIASVITLLGIMLNRMNISIIAFRWDAAVRYVPTWQEAIVTLTIIFIELWVLRWIVRRMPVLRASPEWARGSH